MKHENNFSPKRRHLLKSSAGISVAFATGWTSTVFALAKEPTNFAADKVAGSALPCCDLSIYQMQSSARQTARLLNNTSGPITIDEVSFSELAQKQGSLSLKVVIPQAPVTLQPNEQFSFVIEAHTTNAGWNLGDRPVPNVIAGKIKVKSSHAEFNGSIPVTVFDAVLV